MAHFAKVGSNNIVLEVVVIDNSVEETGAEWLANNAPTGIGERWIQTSYNNNFRGVFAQPGAMYEPELDRFRPFKEIQSWIWDEELYNWIPPLPYPEDGAIYDWDESFRDWIKRD